MKRAIFALGLLLAHSAAHADVGVVVTGEATLQPQLAAQAEGWLKQRGHTVTVSPLEPDAINTIIDCFVIEDLNCARALIEKRAKTQTVIYVRVEMSPNESDGSRNISIVGYWMQKGHEIIGERRNCHACTEKDLHTTADDLMHALAAEPPTSAHVPTPEEAAKAAPAPAETPMVDDTRPSHLVPGVVIGAGVALAITGAVLIAIDQDQADIPKTGPQPADFRDTATGGVICVGLGAAAIATGAFLWFYQGSSSAPVASVTHDAAVVGWAGRF